MIQLYEQSDGIQSENLGKKTTFEKNIKYQN